MSHTTAMSLVERAGNLRSVLKYLRHGQRPFFQTLRQRFAIQVFHNNEVNAVLLADIVESANVGMIQAGYNFGFPVETLAARGIVREVRRQNLDGDGAIKPRIARAIDFSHAPRAERRKDIIRP
jgi:hypothetical protein